ncbi:MAG: glucosyl hydrolase family protein [Anaerocolumna sp.]|jgi:rhamnogalacturonyl hydrolase YesR|nr:glucosyl hydrolase family protein [Anaerocolumna sp.]
MKNNLEKAKLALLAMQRYSWEQGVTMQAFLELGEMEVVIALAKEAAYRQMVDGRAATIGYTDAVTDPCSTGEALYHAYLKTNSNDLKIAYEKLLEWALIKAPRNEKGVLYHLTTKPEFWIDSMYMLPPFLASVGQYEEALKQVKGYWEALYNEEYGLLSHMWDDSKKEYIRKDFWGVGNGWAIAGIARIIDLLPNEMKNEKDELIHMVTDLLNNILKYVRYDGLFHDVINNKETFVETNLSQMVAYTIYRGLLSGWLQPDMEAIAVSLRDAANKKVDEYGLVQDVCGAPEFNKPGVAPEGQAFYLLMESVADQYYKIKK